MELSDWPTNFMDLIKLTVMLLIGLWCYTLTPVFLTMK